MKKIYIAVGIVVALLIGTLIFFKMKDHSLDKTLEKVKAYDHYILECQMEMVQNDELKNYEVTVTYLAKDKQDYYKVELYDKSLNQSQIIIKNTEGVFVLTPSLNQMFKFQSDWPSNSPKPYIYQSLIALLENNEVEKIDKGYLVRCQITYPNDERIVLQEMTFDKNLAPQTIICYDKDETEIITTQVTRFDVKDDIDEDEFDYQKVLKNASEVKTSSDASILYPVSMMGSTLDSESVSVIDGKENHVLKFVGDKNYTLIESSAMSDDTMINEVDEEVIELVDGFAYYQDGKLTMMNSGMVCSLYSSDLTKEEMISIMSSMQSSSTK